MVGVPCLDMCQVGPSSRMDCPAFRRRRMGIRICPAMAVTPKATIKLRMYVIGQTSRSFLSLGHANGSVGKLVLYYTMGYCTPFTS